jgi:hypothetical protein
LVFLAIFCHLATLHATDWLVFDAFFQKPFAIKRVCF